MGGIRHDRRLRELLIRRSKPMTRINRRNCLALMGSAGAGLALGAACSKPSEAAQNTSPNPKASPEQPVAQNVPMGGVISRSFESWPGQSTKPRRCESITLVFDGLLGFFYDEGRQECQIGFHPGNGKHKAGVELWERPESNCEDPASPGTKPTDLPPFDKVTDISLKVVDRPPNVDFYRSGDSLDRISGDDMDFRWLIDLDEYYRDSDGKPYGRRKAFQPVLRVKNGTFYTRKITRGLLEDDEVFQRVDSKYRLSQQVGTIIGHLPLMMAAAINLQPTERVLLEYTYKDGHKQSKELAPAAGKMLELDFFSRCDKDVCKPEPCDDGDETKRNDFYFMRKVLDLPGGLPKYSFALAAGPHKPAPIPAKCHKARLTDEAPCAGSGYGGAGCCR